MCMTDVSVSCGDRGSGGAASSCQGQPPGTVSPLRPPFRVLPRSVQSDQCKLRSGCPPWPLKPLTMPGAVELASGLLRDPEAVTCDRKRSGDCN